MRHFNNHLTLLDNDIQLHTFVTSLLPMSNDAQQQQDGLPEGTELPAAAQPAPAPGTTDRRGFLQTLAGIGLVAGAELVLPETTAKAEPIRSGSGRKPEEKQEVQKDPRPIVRAMQCFPKAEPPYFTSKTIEGRLIGELDTNNFSKEELAEIMKMKPRVDGYIAVMIDTNDKEHGGEVIAWMLETEKKAEEKVHEAIAPKHESGQSAVPKKKPNPHTRQKAGQGLG